MTHSHITDHAKKKAWKVSNTFSSGPVRFNTVKISQNLPYSLTENDQNKHLPNVSEMISDHFSIDSPDVYFERCRASIVMGYGCHDSAIQNFFVNCSGAKRQFNESKKKRDQSRVLAGIAKFFIACKQKQNRKKPVNQFENHSLKVFP